MVSSNGRRATPRPVFDGPQLIARDDAPHHVWGDPAGGLVTDRVILSSDQLHVLEFELPGGAGFRHTAENPTLFAADVAYLCLAGTLVLADPECGEVAMAEAGSGLAFARDTWHHGFSLGPTTARVLEFMAPPPSRGTASTYGRTKPLLATTTYADERWSARWPAAADEQKAGRRFTPLRTEDALLSSRANSPAHLVHTLLDTEFLRVTRGLLQPGAVDPFVVSDSEQVFRVVDGEIWFDVEDGPSYWVVSARPGDHVFVPAGRRHRLLVRADVSATYLAGAGSVPTDWQP